MQHLKDFEGWVQEEKQALLQAMVGVECAGLWGERLLDLVAQRLASLRWRLRDSPMLLQKEWVGQRLPDLFCDRDRLVLGVPVRAPNRPAVLPAGSVYRTNSATGKLRTSCSAYLEPLRVGAPKLEHAEGKTILSFALENISKQARHFSVWICNQSLRPMWWLWAMGQWHAEWFLRLPDASRIPCSAALVDLSDLRSLWNAIRFGLCTPTWNACWHVALPRDHVATQEQNLMHKQMQVYFEVEWDTVANEFVALQSLQDLLVQGCVIPAEMDDCTSIGENWNAIDPQNAASSLRIFDQYDCRTKVYESDMESVVSMLRSLEYVLDGFDATQFLSLWQSHLQIPESQRLAQVQMLPLDVRTQDDWGPNMGRVAAMQRIQKALQHKRQGSL